jgi:hypothetical protein
VHGRDEKCIQKFSWKIGRGDTTWETQIQVGGS